ncbi:formin-2 isoform X2 [Dendroctonus ponderosae]|uniref:FH2 domain-containing protein n=1 Tax=Dendroctonus ponderosae TaxID=77166 RepID=A0AAR5PQC9_DENPD|nr:formin-2 isoform X2 [Dendroctonus ponderosae]
MGNLQTSDGGKGASKSAQKATGRQKMRLLGGKKAAKTDEWTKVVPDTDEEDKTAISAVQTPQICEDEDPFKNVSSSDSNFTLALSPAGLNPESAALAPDMPPLLEQSGDFLSSLEEGGHEEFHSLNEVFQPLNIFKLNEFRARVDQEKVTKLSKLGVSKTSQISLEGDGSGFSTGVLELNDELKQTLCPSAEELPDSNRADKSQINGGCQPVYKRHMSVPLDVNVMSDGANLQKATSLSRAELEARLQRPKFVPEKLNFQLYEKFEGYMLVNWYLSELSSDSPAKSQLGVAELKLLASQFCTHLLAAGVLRQLPDPGVPPTTIFRPDCIYYWSHAEVPHSQPQTPGRLSAIYWPPASPCEVPSSPNDIPEHPGNDIAVRPQEMRSSARDVEILSLEEEIKSLRQEVEKYKTLIEIQNLTSSAVKDFESPTEERHPASHLNGSNLKVGTVEVAINTERSTVDATAQAASATREFGVLATQETKCFIDAGTQTDFQQLEAMSSQTSSSLESSISSPEVPALQTSLVIPVSPPLPPSSAGNAAPNLPPPPPPPLPGGVPAPPPPPPPPLSGIPPPPPPPFSGIPAPPPPPFSGIPPPPPPPGPRIPAPPPCPGMPPPPPMPASAGGPKAPPPPPGGPLSMPVPPAGGFDPLRAATKKAPINPPVPMKPLYWTRILVKTEKLENSSALWDEIDELPIETLPEDFMKLFSRQVVNRTPTIKKQEQKPKVEVVKLLDSKRSQSVGILAHSLRQDFNEIENAIYTFDTSVVCLEALQQIYEVRASSEELALINEHLKTRPDVPLDKPEQFLHDLSQIANFAERIACLTFQVEFEDSITTISHTLDNFQSTCEFLTKSPELRRVLALVLTLGNYMNGGNVARGQADGFGLDVLSRLRDVKGAQAGVTLLHFVVSTYAKKITVEDERQLPLPVPEPGDVRRAMTLDFDAMKTELNQLKSKLNECAKRTEKIIANSTPDNLQPFKDKMETFLEKSRIQYDVEYEKLDECHKVFIATMKVYLFKPKSGPLEAVTPANFFEMWLPFCLDFKDIYKKELMRMHVARTKELKRKEYHKANSIKERENGLKVKFKRAKAKLSDSKRTHEGSHDTL